MPEEKDGGFQEVEISTMFGKRIGKIIGSGTTDGGIRYRLVDAGATIWRQELVNGNWETKSGQPKTYDMETPWEKH